MTQNTTNPYELRELTIEIIEKRGVKMEDIGTIVLDLQKDYHPDLTLDRCMVYVMKVLKKREVQHAVMTGIALDMAAEEKSLPEPLQTIVENDEPLFGTDESLATSIVNVYGSIGLTNFGFVDKTKPGIIGDLDKGKGNKVHTFLDDIIGAIAAAAASSLAHHNPEISEDILR